MGDKMTKKSWSGEHGRWYEHKKIERREGE
jgi:hypothetical protein